MHLVYQEEKQILLIFVALSVLVKVVIKVVGLGASSCFSHDLHVFVVLQLENRKKKKTSNTNTKPLTEAAQHKGSWNSADITSCNKLYVVFLFSFSTI